MNFKKNALRTVVGAAAMTGVAAAQAGTWAATSGAPALRPYLHLPQVSTPWEQGSLRVTSKSTLLSLGVHGARH